MNSQLAAIFLAITLLLTTSVPTLAVDTTPTTQPDAVSVLLWRTVLQNWTAQLAAVKSIHVSYSTCSKGFLGNQKPTMELTQVGEKFLYTTTQVAWFNTSRTTGTIVMTTAFDGKTAWRKSSLSGIVSQSSTGKIKTDFVDPLRYVMPISPLEMEAKCQSVQLAIQSAQRASDGGKAVIEVEVLNLSNQQKFTASFSTTDGYLPIHLIDMDASGHRTSEGVIDDIAAIKADDGATCFYPIHAKRTGWNVWPRNVIYTEELQVDRASIRINGTIPPENLRINILPSDSVFDADTRQWLQNKPVPRQPNQPTSPVAVAG